MSTLGLHPKAILEQRLGNRVLGLKLASSKDFAANASSVSLSEEKARAKLYFETKRQCPACHQCSSLRLDIERHDDPTSIYGETIYGSIRCASARNPMGSVVTCKDGQIFSITSKDGEFTPISDAPTSLNIESILAASRRVNLDHAADSSYTPFSKFGNPREIILKEFVKMAPNEQTDLLDWLERMVKKRDKIKEEKVQMDKPVTEMQDAW